MTIEVSCKESEFKLKSNFHLIVLLLISYQFSLYVTKCDVQNILLKSIKIQRPRDMIKINWRNLPPIHSLVSLPKSKTFAISFGDIRIAIHVGHRVVMHGCIHHLSCHFSFWKDLVFMIMQIKKLLKVSKMI